MDVKSCPTAGGFGRVRGRSCAIQVGFCTALTRPGQARTGQTRPDPTTPDQTDHTRPGQDHTRPGQATPDQRRPGQARGVGRFVISLRFDMHAHTHSQAVRMSAVSIKLLLRFPSSALCLGGVQEFLQRPQALTWTSSKWVKAALSVGGFRADSRWSTLNQLSISEVPDGCTYEANSDERPKRTRGSYKKTCPCGINCKFFNVARGCKGSDTDCPCGPCLRCRRRAQGVSFRTSN